MRSDAEKAFSPPFEDYKNLHDCSLFDGLSEIINSRGTWQGSFYFINLKYAIWERNMRGLKCYEDLSITNFKRFLKELFMTITEIDWSINIWFPVQINAEQLLLELTTTRFTSVLNHTRAMQIASCMLFFYFIFLKKYFKNHFFSFYS